MKRVRRHAAWMLIAMLGCLAAPGAAEAQRGYAPGSFGLELSGAPAGLLRSASGGEAVGEVVSELSGSSYVKKHIAAVKYSDLVLEVGAGMEPAVYDWIAAAWDAKANRMSGAVLVASYNLQVVGRRDFQSALIAETALPTLDASSKEPAFLSVRLAPEYVKVGKGGGSLPSTLAAKTQQLWLASNFRLEIPGLDCSRVRRIEGFKVQTAVQSTEREGLVPTAVNVADFAVTFPEAFADTWYDWTKSFLIEGNSGDGQEKNGDLVLLGTDRQSEIARVHLFGLGIKTLQSVATDSGSQIRSLVATLYCERAALEWKGGTASVMNVRVFGR